MRFHPTVSVLSWPLLLVTTVPSLAAPAKNAVPTVKIVPAAQPINDDKAEPEAQYELQINGKPYPFTLEKEMWVGMKPGPTRLKLVRSPLRQFDKRGVSFQYPVDYTFEADDSDPNVLIWTLSGTNTLLMVQQFARIPLPTLTNAVTSEAINLYGHNNVRLSPVTLAAGTRKLQGKRLSVTLAKQKLTQEFYAFSTPKNSFLLVVQDSSGKDWPTDQFRRLKNLLFTSLHW